MGFLLTSYNSLPEQVEANKEKCKDLQTQINNIDTHEIEEVKAQVQTNTQNISNLTQGLGVTNTAVNAVTQDVNGLKPRVTNLETKTSNMSKSGVDTAFTESINVAKSINAGTNINADGLITAGNDIISEGVIKGEVLVAENDLGEGRFAIDNDGDMSLYNPANAGKLITTGNIEEYAPQTRLYRHVIQFIRGSYFKFEIITKSETPFTVETLASHLYNVGYRGTNSNDGIQVTHFDNKDNIYMGQLFSNNGTSLYFHCGRFLLSASSQATVSLGANSGNITDITDVVTEL